MDDLKVSDPFSDKSSNKQSRIKRKLEYLLKEENEILEGICEDINGSLFDSKVIQCLSLRRESCEDSVRCVYTFVNGKWCSFRLSFNLPKYGLIDFFNEIMEVASKDGVPGGELERDLRIIYLDLNVLEVDKAFEFVINKDKEVSRLSQLLWKLV